MSNKWMRVVIRVGVGMALGFLPLGVGMALGATQLGCGGLANATTGAPDPSTSGASSDPSTSTDVTTGGGTELTCAYFCSVQGVNCPDLVYASEQACLEACMTWPAGTAADTTGDTLACRLGYADKGESCINDPKHSWKPSPRPGASVLPKFGLPGAKGFPASYR